MKLFVEELRSVGLHGDIGCMCKQIQVITSGSWSNARMKKLRRGFEPASENYSFKLVPTLDKRFEENKTSKH